MNTTDRNQAPTNSNGGTLAPLAGLGFGITAAFFKTLAATADTPTTAADYNLMGWTALGLCVASLIWWAFRISSPRREQDPETRTDVQKMTPWGIACLVCIGLLIGANAAGGLVHAAGLLVLLPAALFCFYGMTKSTEGGR